MGEVMPKVTEEEYADKWAKRLKASTEEIKKGVDRVTVSPGKKAVEKIDLMLAKLIEAFESGRVERGLLGFSLEDWQEDMKTKGVRNIPGGVDRAKDKQVAFARWLLNRVKQGQDIVSKMDEGTLEASIARMEVFVRHMAKEKYK